MLGLDVFMKAAQHDIAILIRPEKTGVGEASPDGTCWILGSGECLVAQVKRSFTSDVLLHRMPSSMPMLDQFPLYSRGAMPQHAEGVKHALIPYEVRADTTKNAINVWFRVV